MTPEVEVDVRKLATWIPVTWEQLIDMGEGTPEMIEWDRQRQADLVRRRRSWRGRWRRFTHAMRFYGLRGRFTHAWAALRGIECERDW